MKRGVVTVLIFLICVIPSVSAQESMLDVYHLPSIAQLDSLRDYYNSHKNEVKWYKFQKLGYLYNHLGRYEDAAKLFSPKSISTEISDCEKVIIKEARQVIIERATLSDIVIINENHYDPYHRHFVRELLSQLKGLGYTHLALEALVSDHKNYINDGIDHTMDEFLNERGYPLARYFSGGYLNEPQMSNLVREAIKHGIKVIGYESWGKKREEGQAKNIYQSMKRDSIKKLIILCGGGHLEEGVDVENGKMKMAGFLKLLTGKDPLTINQTFSDHNLTCSQQSSLSNRSYMLLGKEGKDVFANETKYDWDLTVFHPKPSYVRGRPRWLSEKYKPITIDVTELNLTWPFTVKLLKVSDRIDAIPIDLYAPRSNESNVTLYGDEEIPYKVLVEKSSGERYYLDRENK